MKKAIIAAPFGVYIKTDWATSVRGTYTLQPRPGVISQSLKTFRPIKDGWINKMGFRNKGISSELINIAQANRTETYLDTPIWSIGAVNTSSEWEALYNLLKIYPNITLELNRGCPNVPGGHISPIILKKFIDTFDNIIIKVPGQLTLALTLFEECYDIGVRTFHFCNTIPTDKGGESSRRIQEVSLFCIDKVKKHYKGVTCIGGGGIYSVDDVKKYKEVGTDHFSLATVFFTPWRLKGIRKEIYS